MASCHTHAALFRKFPLGGALVSSAPTEQEVTPTAQEVTPTAQEVTPTEQEVTPTEQEVHQPSRK